MSNYYEKQRQMLGNHPNVHKIILNDPVAMAWYQMWLESDKTVEQGLSELASQLFESKQAVNKEYIEYAKNDVRPVVINGKLFEINRQLED